VISITILTVVFNKKSN